MNLNINPHLTTSIAADRRRAYALEAEISRTRKIGRLARRAARFAVQADVSFDAAVAASAPIAPIATIAASALDASLLASSDLEHASARAA